MWRLSLLLGVSLFAGIVQAVDHLVVISPHRKSIQNEFVSLFEEHYWASYKTEVKVDWIDQGGTENDLRYVLSKYEKGEERSGIDIFWGGGDMTFIDLDQKALLEPYKVPPSLSYLPSQVAGIRLRSEGGTWYGSAVSGFGLFYNKPLLKILKIREPQHWEDLGKKEFLDQVVLADPRQSATSLTMNLIMLEALGWEKGWELLFSIAGNSRTFTHSSSDPIKAVVNGDAAVAPAIDFYANAKILDLSTEKLGFVLPPGKTVLNSDPIAILKGAPNRLVAERFVEFVLSEKGQKLLVLRKGDEGGPRVLTLGRMAVNPRVYESLGKGQLSTSNPFTMPTPKLQVSFDKFAQTKQVLSDLIGALHIDLHKELRDAWRWVLTSKAQDVLLAKLAAPPIAEQELQALIPQWDDSVFRNKKINEWIRLAKTKYGARQKLL